MRKARAFAPAAISSFFEICDTTPDGKPIANLELVGARGGGFGLQKGVQTQICVSESKKTCITVSINGKPAPEAKTTLTALRLLLTGIKKQYNISVGHSIEVPVGAGFGTSAGGALTAGLALKEALDLPLTINQIGTAAHISEIQCQTGLGTVTPLSMGGSCILVLEPGAPGIGVIDRIPLPPKYMIVSGIISSTPTTSILSSPQNRLEINRYGKKTLKAILKEPSVENFLACCWQFAQKTGFATEKIKELVHIAKDNGAVGAAQNMVGEAVHAVVREEKVVKVQEAFKQVLHQQSILVSKLDSQGARLESYT